MTTAVRSRPAAPVDRYRATTAQRLALGAIILCYLGVSAYYNVTNPIWEVPDEPAHYAYVEHIVRTGTLPVRENTVGDQYHQPPLYYLLGSLAVGGLELDEYAVAKPNDYFMWRAEEERLGLEPNVAVHTLDERPPYTGTVLAVHILRFISSLCGLIAVVVAYLLTRTVLYDRPWLAVGAAAFTAFTPQFLFVSAGAGNDGPAIALGSLLILELVRIAQRVWAGQPVRKRQFVLVGVWLGLGFLSKLTFTGLMPLLAVAVIYTLAVARQPLRLIGNWLLAGVVAMLLSGWWLLRNVLVHANILAIFGLGKIDPRTGPIEVVEKQEEIARALSWYPEPLFQSFWLRFGWMNIYPDQWVYDLALVVTVAAALGCLAYAVRYLVTKEYLGTPSRIGLAFAFLAPAGVLAVTTWRFVYTLGNHYPQGRYLFPAQAAVALLFVLGLAELAGLVGRLAARITKQAGAVDALRGVASAPLALGFAAALALGSLWAANEYIKPAYAEAPIWLDFDESTLANRVDANFANQMSILGFEMAPAGSVAAGQDLTLSLYWQAEATVGQDYQAFVHLADETGRPLAQKDGPAGGSVYPTSKWVKGEVVLEERVVPVPADMPPGEYQILLGVYDLQTLQRLPVVSGAGGDSVRLGTVTVDPAPAP